MPVERTSRYTSGKRRLEKGRGQLLQELDFHYHFRLSDGECFTGIAAKGWTLETDYLHGDWSG